MACCWKEGMGIGSVGGIGIEKNRRKNKQPSSSSLEAERWNNRGTQ